MEQMNKPTDMELDARIMALVNQRNMAMDQSAVLLGKVAILEAQLGELQQKYEQLQSKDKDREKPQDKRVHAKV